MWMPLHTSQPTSPTNDTQMEPPIKLTQSMARALTRSIVTSPRILRTDGRDRRSVDLDFTSSSGSTSSSSIGSKISRSSSGTRRAGFEVARPGLDVPGLDEAGLEEAGLGPEAAPSDGETARTGAGRFDFNGLETEVAGFGARPSRTSAVSEMEVGGTTLGITELSSNIMMVSSIGLPAISAFTNEEQLSNRSARNFAVPRPITAFTASESPAIAGMASFSTHIRRTVGSAASNGRCPASSSNAITDRAY